MGIDRADHSRREERDTLEASASHEVIRRGKTYLDGDLDETERNGSEQHNWIPEASQGSPNIESFQSFGYCKTLILHTRDSKRLLFWCQPTRLGKSGEHIERISLRHTYSLRPIRHD